MPISHEVLELWGGELHRRELATPDAPEIASHDGRGERTYQLIALGPQGTRSLPSAAVKAQGNATLQWGSTPGADSYLVLRDGKELATVRIEGSRKTWKDAGE